MATYLAIPIGDFHNIESLALVILEPRSFFEKTGLSGCCSLELAPYITLLLKLVKPVLLEVDAVEDDELGELSNVLARNEIRYLTPGLLIDKIIDDINDLQSSKRPKLPLARMQGVQNGLIECLTILGGIEETVVSLKTDSLWLVDIGRGGDQFGEILPLKTDCQIAHGLKIGGGREYPILARIGDKDGMEDG